MVTSCYCQSFNGIYAAASSDLNWPKIRIQQETAHLSAEFYRTCSHFGFRVPVQLNSPVHFHIPMEKMSMQPCLTSSESEKLLNSSAPLDESSSFNVSSSELSSASSDLYMPKLVTVRILFNRGWTDRKHMFASIFRLCMPTLYTAEHINFGCFFWLTKQ